MALGSVRRGPAGQIRQGDRCDTCPRLPVPLCQPVAALHVVAALRADGASLRWDHGDRRLSAFCSRKASCPLPSRMLRKAVSAGWSLGTIDISGDRHLSNDLASVDLTGSRGDSCTNGHQGLTGDDTDACDWPRRRHAPPGVCFADSVAVYRLLNQAVEIWVLHDGLFLVRCIPASMGTVRLLPRWCEPYIPGGSHMCVVPTVFTPLLAAFSPASSNSHGRSCAMNSIELALLRFMTLDST